MMFFKLQKNVYTNEGMNHLFSRTIVSWLNYKAIILYWNYFVTILSRLIEHKI